MDTAKYGPTAAFQQTDPTPIQGEKCEGSEDAGDLDALKAGTTSVCHTWFSRKLLQLAGLGAVFVHFPNVQCTKPAPDSALVRLILPHKPLFRKRSDSTFCVV